MVARDTMLALVSKLSEKIINQFKEFSVYASFSNWGIALVRNETVYAWTDNSKLTTKKLLVKRMHS